MNNQTQNDRVRRLERLRAAVARLEAELFDPLCDVCGAYVQGVYCNGEAWTCPHHTLLCETCWGDHKKECLGE